MGDPRIVAASELIWGAIGGPETEETFKRWAQGLAFSASEPTALAQIKGGPCGVLAPLQGFILRSLIFDTPECHSWREPGEGLTDAILVKACAHVLFLAASSPLPPTVAVGDVPEKRCVVIAMHPNSLDEACPVTYEAFLEGIELCEVGSESEEECEAIFASILPHYRSAFGVLLLLYSAVLSRGVINVREDMAPDGDVLITSPFGHASQGLLNLMLTGSATQNVWDGDQDAGGLMLRGVCVRGEIGYLTVVEALHYLKVGSFLKDPRYPIWVLGSESHFTVLFSHDMRLVERKESPLKLSLQAFDAKDESGGGFVPIAALYDILTVLKMDTNEENVSRLSEKLDPDRLGVILRGTFAEVLHPGAVEEEQAPETFTVYHYNGIARPGGQVQYVRGEAKASSPQDFGSSEIMRCLRTKWKKLVVAWAGGTDPSII